VDNRALGLALAAALVRAGGKLSTTEAAVRIETNGGLAVQTPFAFYGADKVIVAAGAWSSGIDMDAPVLPPVRPVKGEMLALTPPKGVALPAHVIWGNGVYLVPRQGRLLIGATAEDIGFDTTTTDKAKDWLFDRALALVPSLRQWTPDDHWAGLRPASPDGLPVLGETSVPNLFVATGQFRNGILFAPAVAEAMSRLVLGNPAPEIRAFSPCRFGEGS
jgi:glycine oxidase